MGRDGTGSRKEALADFIVQQTDEIIGRIEWLHAELQKTGAVKGAERAQGLSERLDVLCGRLDEIERVLRDRGPENPSAAADDVLDRLEDALRTKLSAVERVVRAATEEGVVFTEERAKEMSDRIEELASSLEESGRASGANRAG